MTRRALARGVALGAAAPLWAAGLAQAQTPASLGALAAARGILFGASAASPMLDQPAYRALYEREARVITVDYEMKFAALRPNGPDADFTAADRLADFAAKQGMGLRGHTLIWNENLPGWLKFQSRREVERLFDRHIEEMVTRYAGRVHSWDVVNEPFWPDHGARGGYRRGVWFDMLGPSYVRYAFQRAARFDPKARLTLNEAFCERNDPLGQTVRAALLRLVDELRDNDAPIHAVGLQAHLQPQIAYDDDVFVDFLRALARRKVEIYITELDVDDSGFSGSIAERDARVAERYEAFLTKVLAVPQVKMVVLWQLADRFSWYRDPDAMKLLNITHQARPLPYDDALKRKPAWDAIARALATRPAA